MTLIYFKILYNKLQAIKFSVPYLKPILWTNALNIHDFYQFQVAAGACRPSISTFAKISKNKNLPNLLMPFSKIVYQRGLLDKIWGNRKFHDWPPNLDIYCQPLLNCISLSIFVFCCFYSCLRLVFSTFPSCSQMPVVFYHSLIHGLGFFTYYKMVILVIKAALGFLNWKWINRHLDRPNF